MLEWSQTAGLYALIAPQKRIAVLLRRGPSNHVRLISWDLKSDTFIPGQWLKHRVYERRSDLSPDGRFFIYFAADYSKQPGTYTAVSQPPYFTALSLWFKGDAWGGGGLFSADGRKIYLNHRPGAYRAGFDEMALGEGFKAPPMSIAPLHEGSGWGEDDPICFYRMKRDGWSLVSRGSESKRQGFSSPYHYAKRRPTIYQKRSKAPIGLPKWGLRLSSKYTGEEQGRWNVEEACIANVWGKTVLDLGRVDWCDLDHNGDILWAWAGKLWRLKYNRDPRAFKLSQPKLLADFNKMMFEEMKAPPKVRTW